MKILMENWRQKLDELLLDLRTMFDHESEPL